MTRAPSAGPVAADFTPPECSAPLIRDVVVRDPKLTFEVPPELMPRDNPLIETLQRTVNRMQADLYDNLARAGLKWADYRVEFELAPITPEDTATNSYRMVATLVPLPRPAGGAE